MPFDDRSSPESGVVPNVCNDQRMIRHQHGQYPLRTYTVLQKQSMMCTVCTALRTAANGALPQH